jgi:sugar lactone lactonase YvrE
MLRPLYLVVLLVISVFISCVADSESDPNSYAIRDTLANGVIRVRYERLPGDRVADAEPELRLGVREGDSNLVFGDLRGVDADQDGRIYVLDYLASEIRVFDPLGAYLHTISSKGEGPGELGAANGMILVGDTILWVQDHSKWMMIGFSPDGDELARVPMHVLWFGQFWDGTVDNAGRIWKTDHVSDEDRSAGNREGLREVTYHLYLKSFDQATNSVDSVYLGDQVGRVIDTPMGSGWLHSGIPFDPERILAVDPDGGFWQVHNDTYRVARLNEVGDTVLIVEVDADPIPVSRRYRADYVERSGERSPRFRRVAEEVVQLMPKTKPLIRKLIVDDEGRLWVRRWVKDGADPLYDVFDRDGEFQGSVKLDFRPDRPLLIRIRHGHIYAVVLDELDVPSIVRAKVPQGIGGQARGLGRE